MNTGSPAGSTYTFVFYAEELDVFLAGAAAVPIIRGYP